MIEVKNIYKSFDGKTVLNNVSAQFYAGKTNLIIGQSGSGKTVLVKSIVGLLKPDSGEILYDGRDFTQMDQQQKKALRSEIGMLFQGSALFDSETVLGNVMFPLRMKYIRRVQEAGGVLSGTRKPARSEQQISVRNQWRNAKTRSYRSCHCVKSPISVLRRTKLRARPQDLVVDR